MLSVTEFVLAAKQLLEADGGSAWVEGEVVNFTHARSGHWYFSLRDDSTVVDCVMLARSNRLAQMPKDGDFLAVFGAATLYAPRGRFQLAVRLIRAGGEGDKHRLFLRHKEEWRQRGWFANARPLPSFPQVLGIVCSPAGAVLQDILHVVRARYPLVRVIVYPAPAQGADAGEKIAAMVAAASRRRECDVLIVARGGGSWEDLQAYNERVVVQALYECAIPAVSGIGHETDETLADYAADVRCPTPTAAAAAVLPEAAALLAQLAAARQRQRDGLQHMVDGYYQRLDWSARFPAALQRLLNEKKQHWRRVRAAVLVLQLARQLQQARTRLAACRLPRPRDNIARAAERLAALRGRCRRALTEALARRTARQLAAQQALELLSPQRLLVRGYSLVLTPDGKVINQLACLPPQVTIRLSDGEADAVIGDKRGN